MNTIRTTTTDTRPPEALDSQAKLPEQPDAADVDQFSEQMRKKPKATDKPQADQGAPRPTGQAGAQGKITDAAIPESAIPQHAQSEPVKGQGGDAKLVDAEGKPIATGEEPAGDDGLPSAISQAPAKHGTEADTQVGGETAQPQAKLTSASQSQGPETTDATPLPGAPLNLDQMKELKLRRRMLGKELPSMADAALVRMKQLEQSMPATSELRGTLKELATKLKAQEGANLDALPAGLIPPAQLQQANTKEVQVNGKVVSLTIERAQTQATSEVIQASIAATTMRLITVNQPDSLPLETLKAI